MLSTKIPALPKSPRGGGAPGDRSKARRCFIGVLLVRTCRCLVSWVGRYTKARRRNLGEPVGLVRLSGVMPRSTWLFPERRPRRRPARCPPSPTRSLVGNKSEPVGHRVDDAADLASPSDLARKHPRLRSRHRADGGRRNRRRGLLPGDQDFERRRINADVARGGHGYSRRTGQRGRRQTFQGRRSSSVAR